MQVEDLHLVLVIVVHLILFGVGVVDLLQLLLVLEAPDGNLRRDASNCEQLVVGTEGYGARRVVEHDRHDADGLTAVQVKDPQTAVDACYH